MMVEERENGDTYYVGPLDPAMQIAVDEDTEIRVEKVWDHYQVNSDHHWGNGKSLEEAWRYFLGAMFGPIDSEYDDEHVRQMVGA